MRMLMIAIIVLAMVGCDALVGKEVARIPVNELSTKDSLVIKETKLDLKQGEEITFWSEMDVDYEGNTLFEFRVRLLRDGKVAGGLQIDPTEGNITLSEVRTTVNDKTSWRFTKKNKAIVIDTAGNYTIQAVLFTNSATAKIEKAELVIKK